MQNRPSLLVPNGLTAPRGYLAVPLVLVLVLVLDFLRHHVSKFKVQSSGLSFTTSLRLNLRVASQKKPDFIGSLRVYGLDAPWSLLLRVRNSMFEVRCSRFDVRGSMFEVRGSLPSLQGRPPLPYLPVAKSSQIKPKQEKSRISGGNSSVTPRAASPPVVSTPVRRHGRRALWHVRTRGKRRRIKARRQ